MTDNKELDMDRKKAEDNKHQGDKSVPYFKIRLVGINLKKGTL